MASRRTSSVPCPPVPSTGSQVIESTHSRSSFVYGGGIGVTFIDHLNVSAEYDAVRIQDADNSNALWPSTAWRF